MSDLRKAAQQALEALESSRVFVTSREKTKHPEGTEWYDERVDTLRAALAQPIISPEIKGDKAEPVAWWDGKESVVFTHDEIYTPNWTDYWTRPLYANPPQRQPLTEEEVFQVAYAEFPYWSQDIQSAFVTQFARAIEKAHGIGGTE